VYSAARTRAQCYCSPQTQQTSTAGCVRIGARCICVRQSPVYYRRVAQLQRHENACPHALLAARAACTAMATDACARAAAASAPVTTRAANVITRLLFYYGPCYFATRARTAQHLHTCMQRKCVDSVKWAFFARLVFVYNSRFVFASVRACARAVNFLSTGACARVN
jgi:hypothetical protein